RRRAAREKLDVPVREPVEDADFPLPVEGGDEQLAPAAHGRHLGAAERGTVEVARLGVRSQPGASRGDAVDGSEVVGLTAHVAAPGPGKVEGPGLVEREG